MSNSTPPGTILYVNDSVTRTTTSLSKDALPRLSQDALPRLSKDALPRLSKEALPRLSKDALPRLSKDATPRQSTSSGPRLSDGVAPQLSMVGSRLHLDNHGEFERCRVCCSDHPLRRSSSVNIPLIKPMKSSKVPDILVEDYMGFIMGAGPADINR